MSFENQNLPAVYIRRDVDRHDEEVEFVHLSEVKSAKSETDDLITIPPSLGTQDDDEIRTVYRPIPEKKRLGYFSTASIIINAMIGTGVFSQPSAVLRGTGSKGGALFLWVAGGIMTLSSLFVYMEFGIFLPFTGGELVYLEEGFPNPRYLLGCMFAVFFVFLEQNAANCIAFAKYMIVAVEPSNPVPDDRLVKFVAIMTLIFTVLVHFFSRKYGVLLSNFLAVYKLALLTFVVLAGFAALAGNRAKDDGTPYGTVNLKNAFAGSSKSPHSWATAMLGVLYSYDGWENVNRVLGEVKRPAGNESRTYKRAILISFGTVSLLYVLANVSYFAALTTDELLDEGVLTAASFFLKVFGDNNFVNRGLKVLIAISALGNILTEVFTGARVKREIAKQGLLPFGKIIAKESPYGTPVGALVLHGAVNLLIIAATPPSSAQDEAYSLVSNLYAYGHTICWIGVGIALLLLNRQRRFSYWKPKVLSMPLLVMFVFIQLILSAFIIALNWWPTPTTGTLAWYITPVASTSVLAAGVLYWLCFAKISPALGYKVVTEQIMLVDGSQVIKYKRHKTGLVAYISSYTQSISRTIENWLPV